MLGGGLNGTGGKVRRLGAGGVLLACLIALPGQAEAVPAPPTIAIAAPETMPAEGQPVVFTITRDGTEEDLAVPTVVTVETSNGSAVAGEDYTATSQEIPFAAGDREETFSVPTTDDDIDEDNETFTATVTVVANGTPGTTSATGTIGDGDLPPSVSISGSPSPTEGAAATFTVTIAGKSENTVTVNYAAAGISATAGADFTATPGQLIWDSRDTTPRTITVPTTDDAIDEDNETFQVNLTGYSPLVNSSATGTIVDGDNPPTVVEVRDVEVTEDNTTANILVRLSGPSGKDITIDYGPGEGSTANADDHVPPSGRLTIAKGATQGSIPVTIKEDTLFEGDETVFVNLFGHVNVATPPGTDVQGKVTIKDDGDAAAAPTVPNASVAEGNSALTDLTFQVTLAGPRPKTTFNYRTVAGTADDSDYVGGLAQIELPASSSTTPPPVPLTIKVKGDVLDEADETFTLQLLNPTNQAVVATATGTITNDDNNTELLVADASVDEPPTGNATLKFTLSLSVASGRTVSVSWQTADGTATAGTDYSSASGSVDFEPGQLSKVIDVGVIGDTINEENETVVVNLSGSGATLIDRQAIGTIIDKNAPPSLSISDPLARESEGAKFTVTLAGTTLRTVTVRFNTADGGGKAGSDYEARVGSLTFAPGEKSKTIEVTVLDDAVSEPNEDFFVLLDDPVNASITKGRGRASIEASDQVAAPPTPPVTPPKTPPVVGKPTTVLVPRMILGPRTVSVGPNGIARMLVTCQRVSPIGCAGTVELERAGKPLLRLGKRAFSVKKGAKGYASIKLTTRGLAALRKSGTLRAKVVVIVKTSAKSMKVSPGIILLKSVKTVAKPKPPTTKVVVDP